MDEQSNNITSRPADPSYTSFLDLPAEIRNFIYAEIFEHDDPITVTLAGQHSGPVKLHRRVGDRNDTLPYVRSQARWVWDKSEAQPVGSNKYRLNDTVQAYQEGLSLFLTCQQISREARSVFYSSNTFLITEKREYGSTGYHRKCSPSSLTLDLWLKDSETRRKLVKKISLDLASICTVECYETAQRDIQIKWGCALNIWPVQNHYDFAFLAFLKIVWKHDVLATISIVDVKPDLAPFQHVVYKPFQILTIMSKTLQCLCNDEINMARFRKTLACVSIKRNGSGGDFVFQTSSKHLHVRVDNDGDVFHVRSRGAGHSFGHGCVDSVNRFSLGDGGQLSLIKRPVTLSNLPRHIRTTIWDMVANNEGSRNLHLDGAKDFSAGAAPMYVNCELRRLYAADILLRRGRFLMHSASARARIPAAPKLERLLNVDFVYRSWTDSMDERTAWSYRVDSQTLEFLLAINPPSATTLDEVRIDILPFTIASSQTWNDRELEITVGDTASVPRKATVKLGLLRRRVLAALKSYAKEHRDSSVPCPEIWINGRGVVKEVIPIKANSSSTMQGRVEQPEGADSASSSTLASTHHTRGQVDGTIRYLAEAVRSWQKAK